MSENGNEVGLGEPDGRAGLAVVAVLEAAVESSRTGRAVEVARV